MDKKIVDKNQLVSQLRRDLEQAHADHHKLATSTSVNPEHVSKAAQTVKSLSKKIAEIITDGANPCPTCKQPPHGMLKREATEREFAVYEVGCLTDAHHRARGKTVEEAVQKWNAKEWVPAPAPVE